jgi:hypothetical protein
MGIISLVGIFVCLFIRLFEKEPEFTVRVSEIDKIEAEFARKKQQAAQNP